MVILASCLVTVHYLRDSIEILRIGLVAKQIVQLSNIDHFILSRGPACHLLSDQTKKGAIQSYD